LDDECENHQSLRKSCDGISMGGLTLTFFDRTENMKTAVTIRFKEGATSLSSELEELSCPAPS
jgi:hypothetical protein